MYKVGITGSIGTGKTTIANIFALFKIPIFNADHEIKKILNNEKIKRSIKKIWPLSVKNSSVDKQKLKSIIFSNKNEKKKLEKLLYPVLNERKIRFEKKNSNKNILVYDIPLIYETKTSNLYDLILLTTCNLELQRKRVLNRDKISNALFEKIIKSQLSFDEKIKYKPRLINTNYPKLITLIKIVLLIIILTLRLKINNEKR